MRVANIVVGAAAGAVVLGVAIPATAADVQYQETISRYAGSTAETQAAARGLEQAHAGAKGALSDAQAQLQAAYAVLAVVRGATIQPQAYADAKNAVTALAAATSKTVIGPLPVVEEGEELALAPNTASGLMTVIERNDDTRQQLTTLAKPFATTAEDLRQLTADVNLTQDALIATIIQFARNTPKGDAPDDVVAEFTAAYSNLGMADDRAAAIVRFNSALDALVAATAPEDEAEVDEEPSVAPTEEPAVPEQPVEVPVTLPEPEPTAPGVDPTNPPVEPTDPPVEPTDPPVDPTDPPVEPTDPPVVPVDPPAEGTDPPPVTTP